MISRSEEIKIQKSHIAPCKFSYCTEIATHGYAKTLESIHCEVHKTDDEIDVVNVIRCPIPTCPYVFEKRRDALEHLTIHVSRKGMIEKVHLCRGEGCNKKATYGFKSQGTQYFCEECCENTIQRANMVDVFGKVKTREHITAFKIGTPKKPGKSDRTLASPQIQTNLQLRKLRYCDIYPPENVPAGTGFKVTVCCMKCEQLGTRHEFEVSMNNLITSQTGCSYCSSKLLCENDCSLCLQKTLFSKLTDLKKRNVAPANIELTKITFHGSSSSKQLFKCLACPHSWLARPLHIVISEQNCPYCCAGGDLCGIRTCKHCFDRSVLSVTHGQLGSFEINDELKALITTPGSNRVADFLTCRMCNHVCKSKTCNIFLNGAGCGFCTGKNMCDPKNNCSFCISKSAFAHKDALLVRGICFVDENEAKRIHSGSSTKKIRHKCLNCGHIWNARPNNSIGHGYGCPTCKLKTERKIRDAFPHWMFQHKFKGLKSVKGRQLSFDFYTEVNGRAVIVELDGRQHFTHISHFHRKDHSFREKRLYDFIKMRYAIERGETFCVIRLHQECVLDDTTLPDGTNWKTFLDNTVRQIDKDIREENPTRRQVYTFCAKDVDAYKDFVQDYDEHRVLTIEEMFDEIELLVKEGSTDEDSTKTSSSIIA